MASIPVSGYPNFSKIRSGKGRRRPPAGGQGISFFGFDELETALSKAIIASPLAVKASLLELGLFGEKETKERTPVHYGVLRASIGHFEPSLIQDPSGPDGGGDAGDAVFDLVQNAGQSSITWGTNIQYAPWIEWGFTFNPGRVVFLPDVGFRFVHPFSYQGAHMFEQGLAKTAEAAPKIIGHWAKQALISGGLDPM